MLTIDSNDELPQISTGMRSLYIIRTAFSDGQLQLLESAFEQHKYLRSKILIIRIVLLDDSLYQAWFC